MTKVLWNKETGEKMQVESVDAREMLANSPDLYTAEDPEGKAGAKETEEGYQEDLPVNVATVENEFRREPVGDDVPEVDTRVQPIIRNPVTDQPRLAMPKGGEAEAKPALVPSDQLGDMTIPELKDYASTHQIELDASGNKADLIKQIRKAQRDKERATKA